MHFICKNYKLFFTIYFIGINILFFMPGHALPQESALAKYGLDKIVHAGIFAGLSIFIYLTRWVSAKVWLWWLMVAAVYGWLIEIVQRATGRDFDLWDVAADGAGALIGVLLWRYIKK